MKNAFSRMGQTCASTIFKGAIAGVLATGALFAASISPVKVTLPEAVTVGSTTLPSGAYTITSVDMNDGNSWFVVRSERGQAITTLHAQRINPTASDDQTQVTLAKDGNAWHFDKLFIRGDESGYQFTDQK
jgi:hypothetical protein